MTPIMLNTVKVCIVATIGMGAFFTVRHYDKDRRQKLQGYFTAMEEKQYETAFWHVNQYMIEHPQDAIAMTYKGITHKSMGKNGKAVEVIKAALELKPRLAMAHHTLGEIYMHLENYEKAVSHFDLALRRSWKPETYYQRAVSFMYQEKFDKAEADFKQVIWRSRSLRSQAQTDLLYIYRLTGQDKKATRLEMQ